MQGIQNIKVVKRATTTLDIDMPWKPRRVKTNKHLILLLNAHEDVQPSLNGL